MLSPLSAWQLLQGIETLHLRMHEHCDNALKVAQFLERIRRWLGQLSGPGVQPYHALAQKYLPRGCAGILTFGIKGGARAGEAFIDAAQFMSHLANIGDAKTLVIHPASTTHRQLSDEEQTRPASRPTWCASRWDWRTSTTSSGTSTRPWPQRRKPRYHRAPPLPA